MDKHTYYGLNSQVGDIVYSGGLKRPGVPTPPKNANPRNARIPELTKIQRAVSDHLVVDEFLPIEETNVTDAFLLKDPGYLYRLKEAGARLIAIALSHEDPDHPKTAENVLGML